MIAHIIDMETQGMSIIEIAKWLNISREAVRSRLQRQGIRPCGYFGNSALYREEDIDQIREAKPRGGARPHKKHTPVMASRRIERHQPEKGLDTSNTYLATGAESIRPDTAPIIAHLESALDDLRKL
jgi:IS30 family transposase